MLRIRARNRRATMSSEQLPESGAGGQESGTPNFADLYKEVHPDAIDDPEKARVMAHASDADEMEGKVARSDATLSLLETHRGIVPPDGVFTSDGPYDAIKDARNKLAEAEADRKKADDSAEQAGKLYDQIQATRSFRSSSDTPQSAPEENR
jgi:hypothetical protein